ncbi:MAG: hypothetical protein FWD71_23715 [Oscillospiraceae bacterium]|nr:hypothetical protein [Oscillospiraceae bacterium]
MQSQNIQNSTKNKNHKSTYREVKIGRDMYCVTSVFTGEKELGATLEKLAVRKMIDEINQKSKELLKVN